MLLRALGYWFSVALSAHAQAPDAQIREIVQSISQERIESTIRKLAGFETRHTLSETDSETRGIGAARRWIKAELERCSKDVGGRLEVAFDEFVRPPRPRIPKPTSIVNVVATLPGTQAAARDRLYVVSGHYDSRASDVMDATSKAPGANDDASGTAAVIEIACVMAKHRFDATLVFMAVAGEEQGLLGATHWAERARRNHLDVAAMITNDIVGSSTSEDGHRDVRWAANAEPDLAGYRIVWREPSAPLWQHAQDVGNVTRHTLKGVSKDHFVFGVQAVDRDGNASPAVFPKPWRR
jgi:acetylornithine deacetylase/succinyl-diaminopimelate desuccinylase-like protein